MNAKEESCSPECDIIIHEEGLIRKWNGSQDPVMNFSFVKADAARAIVSCKSALTSIDTAYPRDLRKHGIRHVFLFAETCRASDLTNLRKKAREAGYAGLCCLYTTEPDSDFIRTDQTMWIAFAEALVAAAKKARDKAKGKAHKRQQKALGKNGVSAKKVSMNRRSH